MTGITLQSCFFKKVSDNIRQILKKKDLNVVYTISKKLNCIIKTGKDKLNHNKHIDKLVYRIDCKDCKASYIGQTKRYLSVRIKEHKRNIKDPSSNYSVITDRLHIIIISTGITIPFYIKRDNCAKEK